jgi:predicted transcriptional regulator
MHYVAKDTLTVRIKPETRDALDAIAANVDRDRSYVVNEALSAYIEIHQWQVEHIQQGLREAKAGKFVSEAAVKKVIGKLRRS